MQPIRYLLAFTAAMAPLPSMPSWSAVGDPVNGKIIAKRWCAECHVVAPEQKQAKTDVPSFQTVARKYDRNQGALAAFLQDPHPKMPDMSLTRQEIDDLTAYIRTQLK